MLNHVARPAKILIGFVGRRRGELLVQAAKTGGARGGTIAYGKGMLDSKILQALSLADVQQELVFIVMSGEWESIVRAIKTAAATDSKRLEGTAIILDVPELFIRKNACGNGQDQEQKQSIRSERMESGHKLVSVIINSGYADDVMAAARKAGATGGSILTARGTGTEEDVQFFGITLVPEKEMLLIVTEKEKVAAIVEAISSVPKLNEPGGGIIFNMNVEEFIVLGK